VLPASPIAENLQRCNRALCTIYKRKEALYGCSYNDKWFLNSGASAHFTSFEFDFVSMTQGNYGCIETANSKAPLFMVAVRTVLIEHEIIDPKCHKLHSVISPPFLRRFPRSQSQLKALKKTFRSMPVTSRGDQ